MTETNVANLALKKLGSWRVYDINANAQLEEEIREHLVQIREDLTRSHVWDFAVGRASLEAASLLPIFGESHAYELPSDYKQTIEVWAQADMRTRIDKFRIEGTNLVTNRDEAHLIYIRDIADPAIWAPDFRECVIYKLAISLCPHYNIAEGVLRRLQSDFENIVFPRAKLNNAWEDASGENNPIEELMRRSTYLQQNRTIV